MKKKLSILMSTLLMFFVVGCGNSKKDNNSDKVPTDTSDTSSDTSSADKEKPTTPQECNFCNSKPREITYPGTATNYTPTTFNASTYNKTLDATLADGVELYKVNYTLNTISSGNEITVYVTEVDLNKATVVAGSYNDSKDPGTYAKTSKIINQVNAWKSNNPTRTLYAATNADFYGSQPVNAFVKDGIILKNGHNVDYNDVPVSSPYLFGISGNQAQVGPMTDSTTQKDNVESRLTYGLEIYDTDCTSEVFDLSIDGILSKDKSTWISKVDTKISNRTVFELTRDELSNNIFKAHVTNIFNVTNTQTFEPTRKVSYLVVAQGLESKIQLDTQVVLGFTKSEDGRWNYYTTILGARHALVEDGNIPSTVAQETSNGATGRVPRTAIGVKHDGKVMIVSVEDLQYGSSRTGVTVNTGVNLKELADFMRYYGAYDAANFDGGGSTQMLANINGTMTVKVRSSDYAPAFNTANSRSVMNTILVVSK